MTEDTDVTWDWLGEHFRVKVLCSLAGVATQILVHNLDTNSNILMDVGDGILRDLIVLPRSYYDNIDTVLISHGHFDHVGSIFSLLAFFRMLNRKNKLTIISPPNVTELRGLVDTFAENYKDSTPFDYEVIEIDSDISFQGITITSFPVQHRGSLLGGGELPQIPAVGFIIRKEEEKIVYTGDTGYFNLLKSHVSEADLAIIEGTYEGDPSNYHLSVTQAGELGSLAKNHLIIHRIPKLK
ncbi:MAG: MBL fold metallo-hydrolase [Candidatus Heimdallarchaeota archaeon]|nr:MBL fold metallo-hydrolase [Candidatus Heimdallarchaeota archaeon]